MIDLVLVRFLRDHTPYRTGQVASFNPTVAENFKKARVVEIIGPLKAEQQLPPDAVEEKPKTNRVTIEKK